MLKMSRYGVDGGRASRELMIEDAEDGIDGMHGTDVKDGVNGGDSIDSGRGTDGRHDVDGEMARAAEMV